MPKPASPVLAGFEKQEIIYAKDQPEYGKLPSLRSADDKKVVLTRWVPTEDEREHISNGADIYLFCWTFGNPLQPVAIEVGACGADLAMFAKSLGLSLDPVEKP